MWLFLFADVIIIKAPLFGVYIMAPDFLETPRHLRLCIGLNPDRWVDPKSRSTLEFYNPHRTSTRVISWGFYLLDPPGCRGTCVRKYIDMYGNLHS